MNEEMGLTQQKVERKEIIQLPSNESNWIMRD